MEAFLLIWVIVVTLIVSLASIGLVVAIMLQFKAVSTSEKAGDTESSKYEFPRYDIDRAVRKDGFSYIRASYRTSQERHFLSKEAGNFGVCYNDYGYNEILLKPLCGYDRDEVVNELRRVLKKYDEANNIPL